jgi:tetratricopeptide (TPR) repeat protein
MLGFFMPSLSLPRFRFVVLSFFSLLFASCGASAVKAPSPESTWQKPTSEECKKFAEAMQAAATKGDFAAYNELIDWNAILDRATSGIDGVPQSKAGFTKGFLSSMQTSGGIAGQIAKQCEDGGSFKMIHLHEQDGRDRALFRLALNNGGANYHDYPIVRQADGKVRAVDIYIFTSGEMITETLRRLFISAAYEESKSILDRLSGKEDAFAKNMPLINQMTAAKNQGENESALACYKQLPAELQKEKFVLLIAMMAAQNVNDKEYEAIMSTFKAAHPSEPCLDFILIDYYILRKEYPQALASSKRMDKLLDGDANMRCLSGRINNLQEKRPQAKAMFQKAIELEDDYLPAYQELWAISLLDKDYDESVRLLDVMNQKCNAQLKELEESEENAEFLQSPQYQKWKEKQASN